MGSWYNDYIEQQTFLFPCIRMATNTDMLITLLKC